MQRGRCEKAADRDAAVGDIGMELVSLPETAAAPAVLLDAEVAGRGQIPDHLFQRHPLLTLQAGERLFHFLSFARTARAAFRPGLPARLRNRFLAGLDRRRVPGQMTGDTIVKHLFDDGIVNALRQAFPGELRESPRKRRFGGNFAAVKPAAQLPQHPVAMQTIDQRPGCGQTAHRLGKKCAGQPQPAFPRPAGPAAGEPDLMLQSGILDRYDELLMAVAERTGLFAEKRKKFRLKKSPAIIYTLLQGHRPHLRYFVVLLVARYRGWPIPYNPAPLDFSVFSQKTKCAAQFCKRLS